MTEVNSRVFALLDTHPKSNTGGGLEAVSSLQDLNSLLRKDGLVLNPAGGVDGFTQVMNDYILFMYIHIY